MMLTTLHEFFLTQSLIDEVDLSLQGQKITKLLKVVIGFGPFTHATFDRIEFWWNTLIVGTSLEGGLLVKKELEGKLFCPNCNQESIIKKTGEKTEKEDNPYNDYLDQFSCPKCNSYQTKIIEGTDILLLNIEIAEAMNDSICV